jgi:signal transduction histidine kinase
MHRILWTWVRTGYPSRVGRGLADVWRGIVKALKIPEPDAPQLMRRIQTMERDIILPTKIAAIIMVWFFFSSRWSQLSRNSDNYEIVENTTISFFWTYAAINVVIGSIILFMTRLPLTLVRWVVYSNCLLDSIFLALLTLVTGGYDSILYYVFLALIVRSAVNVPQATSQLLLSFTVSGCYVMAGASALWLSKTLPADSRTDMGLSAPLDRPAQELFLRMALLVLMTVCCYGVQVLLERQRRALEEAREFALREGQLHSAGRLAAEFAHRIKNPLSIINNASFSLQRALKAGRTPSAEQIQIIQEEVERSDRIITEIMGYAQLSEGRVEKLDVIEEVERAIKQTFPPAAGYPVRICRHFDPKFPVLVMQRQHLFIIFLNLLQNAREALGEAGGQIDITARCIGDYQIEVIVADNGPGIPPDKVERVFEAYYTTKEKGTGIGLATVKQNMGLYGGKVCLESELGKGARFVLTFPARTQISLDRKA